MPNYDFAALSSYDFEQLVRDLLQLELGVTLESFKQGRDKGIDLRYATRRPVGGGLRDIIVQCKHYAHTPYSVLLSHLRKDEVPKVQQLKPARYVVATSMGLTPQNKTQIAALHQVWWKHGEA